MKPLKLEVGKKYKGYGYINEFGEFEFTPEDTGAKAGAICQVKQGANYKVSTTKKLILISLKLEKEQEKMERVKSFLQLTNQILEILHKYAF